MSYPLHRQRMGLATPSLLGGMTLCLDLTRAFDMVDRARLFAGLISLGVTTGIISLLQCVYNTTAYEFEHRGVHRTVKTHRGIRQGCKAAPCLWTVFISVLMTELANKLSPQFLLLCVTIFADDICSHSTFDNEESFETLLHAFGTLLDLIEGTNLELNLAKTTITLRMTGKPTGKIQRKFTLRTQNGTFLKIPRSDGSFTKIKLVRSFKYLGVMLSYHNFERETMRLRLKHSEQTSHQLHRWLFTQRFSAKQRVKIWYQCTFACLRYGIIATGFTDVTITSFYRFCVKQLRRILREPVHLTKENNWTFLHKHNLPHPLLRLRDLCLQTARRSLLRHHNLQDDDILQLTPLPDYDILIQVIDKVYEQVSAELPTTEAPHTIDPHECNICGVTFSTLTSLRRHRTVEHGQRSGKLRLMTLQPTPAVPTCPRCGDKFTTWHRFQYHITFVCTTDLQEIDQVEHRLRVQELLQFARAHQVAALCRNAMLLMYFLHHCAICGKFHSTITGLMRHWNDDHTRTFQNHLPALQFYCAHVEVRNPCDLCSVSYTRYHKCIIWRQLAMLLTEMDLTAVYCDIAETEKLICETCGKAYTTKHGLAQHLQRCHRAEQALHDNNWKLLEITCLIDQAVQTNRAESLLDDPDILQHISAQCLACSKTFRRRQDTSRHVKQGHPSEWAEVERMAADLATRLNPEQKCHCIPAQHHAKHVCLVFQQFALARLLWERDQQAEAVAMPPNLALTSQERMEQLLWSGFVHLLYRLPALKLALTLHCQICGHVSRCGDDLARHLHQHHEALVAESSTYQQLITWVLFQDFGCACNPTRGFGTPGHMCTALLQAAMLGVQAHWQLFLPWTFRTNELLSHIGDLLTLKDLKRISLCLLTRQFDKLWRDRALMTMLKSHCTICGESVSLQYIIVHLRLEHQLGPNDLHPVVVQLCRIYSAEHSNDPYCDHCHELLPTLDVLTFDPVPDLHLPGCPLILHLAAFLMHAVLHKQPFDPLAWPTPQAVEAAFQRQEHQRLMFNVWNSDSAGQDFDLLATCGMFMIQDDTLRDIIKHECLVCNKFFIMPGALAKHLQQHDFKQLNTMWCLHRLQLICQPCSFCGSDQHDESLVCPALLNLAVLLTNGRRSGQCEYDLEWPIDNRPTPQSRHQRRGRQQAQQTPKEEGSRLIHNSLQIGQLRQHSSHGQGDGQDPPPSRGHDPCLAAGNGVCAFPSAGGGQPVANLDGLPQGMAIRSQNPHLATHHGSHDDLNAQGAAGPITEHACQRGRGEGLHSLPPHRCEPTDAVPQVGCKQQPARSEQGTATAHWRGEQDPPSHPSDPPIGDGDHSQISCAQQAPVGGVGGESSSLLMDCGKPDSRGAVELVAQSIISQRLATCEVDAETPESAKNQFGETIGTDDVDDRPKHLVRILVNDTATMCYVNSAMQALAWCTLLCKGFTPSCWAYGFELLRGLCQWNPFPLNLRTFQPFLWLLFGAFTAEDLTAQQDILEFATFIIDRMGPTFLSCRWCTKFQWVTKVSHPLLDSEKGDRFAPILMRFIDHTAPQCTLQDLISFWHDSSGLCRASDQARRCIVLMFDRHIEGQNQKCIQTYSNN